MSRIKSKHTKPEIVVRKVLREMGVKYKLHAKNLPGKPDIILPEKKTALFINGCFWHQHSRCKKAVIPKSNVKYWKNKLLRNVVKQEEDVDLIRQKGWNVLIVWGCQTKNATNIKKKLEKHL